MKIAFLSFYSGVVPRGVETYVHELANKLTDLGNAVTVYQLGHKFNNASYKTIKIPVNVDWAKRGSLIPFANHYGLKVGEFTVKVLKDIDRGTDVVISTNGQWQAVLCSIWTKLHGKKLVISGQSGPGLDDKLNLYSFPDFFIGLTKYQSDWAKKVNPFVKVVTISNGVDLSIFKNRTSDYVKNTILSVGAFTREKRHDLTIKAITRLKDAKLIIVGGSGNLRDEIHDLGNRELGQERFEVLSVSHDKMPEIYKSAKVLAFPTVPWESFGIVMVEAMATNLPVVATDDPIRKEIVGDAGILVDPTNTEDYAKALQKALNTNWGNIPRHQAEKFSWDKIAMEYEELFKTLVG